MGFYTHTLRPTKTHRFIAHLARYEKLLRCYTMNIDNLEAMAGVPSDMLRQVHGSVYNRGKCGGRRIDAAKLRTMFMNDSWQNYNRTHGCVARPDIVLYGESARHIDELQDDIRNCDLVLCLGTRLNVDPIATIVRDTRKPMYIVNAEKLPHLANQIVGLCDTVCDQLENDMLVGLGTKKLPPP